MPKNEFVEHVLSVPKTSFINSLPLFYSGLLPAQGSFPATCS